MSSAILYHILTFVALPFALLYHWYRSINRGRKPSFGERFGFLPQELKSRFSARPLIWLHAVSVGEVIAARPLIKELRSQYSGHFLLLSVTTETGRGVAERDQLADAVIYFPFDILPAVRRLLDAASPELIVVMETEIWPVFICEADRRGIPLLLANGRISERSFPRYQRFAWFFRPLLARFRLLAMQSEADLERIVAIGAPPEKTKVSGNLKYDIPYKAVTPDERNRLRSLYRIAGTASVLVAGSTHPGEEELVLTAYRAALKACSQLFLVLVPRHPERAGQVAELLKREGFDLRLRSSYGSEQKDCLPGAVLLVDTVGELMQFYALSDLAYVGGSLVATGGHNLLEPASLGIPSLFGPHMNNFREVAALVLKYGAGLQVQNPEQLSETLKSLLGHPEERHRTGLHGLKLLADCSGALNRHMEEIRRVLER